MPDSCENFRTVALTKRVFYQTHIIKYMIYIACILLHAIFNTLIFESWFIVAQRGLKAKP